MSKTLNAVEGRKIKQKRGLATKDYWFTHGLQELSTEKFLAVVTKILKGEYVLLKFPYTRVSDSQSEEWNGTPGIFEMSNGRIK